MTCSDVAEGQLNFMLTSNVLWLIALQEAPHPTKRLKTQAEVTVSGSLNMTREENEHLAT